MASLTGSRPRDHAAAARVLTACRAVPVPHAVMPAHLHLPLLLAAASADGTTHTATIPGAPVGSLVRWYVKATDSQGQSTRDPLFASQDDQQYYGTIVADPSDSSNLPVLEL